MDQRAYVPCPSGGGPPTRPKLNHGSNHGQCLPTATVAFVIHLNCILILIMQAL